MLVTNTNRPTTAPMLLGCQVPPLCLRLHGGPLDGQELRLTSAKVSIGGAAGCTLRLRAPSSLPLYVWVLRGPEGCVVRRFAPHVLLNGGAFDEATLFDGDRLRIGVMELEVVSGAHTRFVELEDSGASLSGEGSDSSLFRADGKGDETAESSDTDPWMRPYKRAFASRSNQTSQQRRALRQHHARRTRKLLETLRQQDQELDSLQRALEQKSADAARLTEAQQAASDCERIQLEEEARELASLVEQMSSELRDAAAQRARTAAELGEQESLRTQIEQRELELHKARAESDEIRRSTAAQIEQLKHAFEAIRQERDELAEREERLTASDRQTQATIETLHAELNEAQARRGALQARLEQLQEQVAAAEEQQSHERPQLEQQLKFLSVELERRERELDEVRSATTTQSQQLIASLDQLREEMAELQKIRQAERQQAAGEAEQLAEELAAAKAQLAQRESELRTAHKSGEAEAASLRADLERLQAELGHARQQTAREKGEAALARTQLEAELKTITQQLERRTADWQSVQQSAAAEAAQFAKTIEQLRSDLQSERSLRQQDSEARQADRRRGETELATARQQIEEQAAQVDELRRTLSAEISRLTLQLDQTQRDAGDVQAILTAEQEKFAAEHVRWEELHDELKQTISELTTARAAADQRELRTENLRRQSADEVTRLTAELSQWKEQAEQLHASYEAQQAEWTQQCESLQQHIEQLSAASAAAQQNSAQADEIQQQSAAELARLSREVEQWREEAEQLQASFAAEQANWAQEQSRLQQQVDELLTLQREQDDQLACTMPTGAGLSGSVDPDLDSDRQQLALELQQLAAERDAWQQQRETWEESLRQREEELAAQIAELERQVGEWHQRQSQEHGLAQPAEFAAEPYTPDAVYGSYNPPHNELPPDVTMRLPEQLGLGDLQPRPDALHNFGETAPFPSRAEWEGAAEPYPGHDNEKSGLADQAEQQAADEPEADQAAEAARDSDSVTAVLGRLMQAGLWNAEGGEQSPAVDQTIALGNGEEYESRIAQSEAAPNFDRPHSDELPSELPPVEAEEENFGCTMDMASIVAAREEAPRSWRSELLGEEEPAPADPHDPLAALRALRAEVAGEVSEPAHEVSEVLSEATPADEAALPLQAKGHGSWRAQLLGEDPGHEPAAPAGELHRTGEPDPHLEDVAEPAPVGFTPVAPPPAEPVSDEDSIEAYMSKLLKRVRGDEPESAWRSAPATPAPVAEIKKPAAQVVVQAPQPPASPVDPSEFVPQRQAPEATMSLAAMRELANAASKVAIATHAKKSHTKRFAQRLVKAAVALVTTAGFAVWGLFFHSGAGPWYGVAVGLLLMAYWSLTSLWHIVKALRLKPAGIVPPELEETTDLPVPGEAELARIEE